MAKKRFDFAEWLEERVDPLEPETWLCVFPQDGGIVITCACGEYLQAYGNTLEDACARYDEIMAEWPDEDEDDEGEQWKTE